MKALVLCLFALMLSLSTVFPSIVAANNAPTSNNTIVTEKRQTQLIHLLKQDCGSCHGMTLKGGLGPALLPENLKDKPIEFLKNTILSGRPGTAMPPWQGILTEQEALWLTQQIQQGLNHAQK